MNMIPVSVKKAVFFDLDGTLCNTLSDLTASINYAMRTFDYPTHTEAQVSRMVGDGIAKLCERAIPDAAKLHREPVRALFLAHYAAHCLDKTQPYDGIPHVLRVLKERGYALAVITNKHHQNAERIVSALFPPETFSVVLGQSDAYPLKPDPAMLCAAASHLRLLPDGIVYIGDSDVDVCFAGNAGVRFIGCAWGFRGARHLKESGAETVVDTPLALLDELP